MSKLARIGVLAGCYVVCWFVVYKTGETIGGAIAEIFSE